MSGTNTDTDKVHGKTKTVARIESRKTAASLPLIYYVMCLTFLFENLPLNKMYNVFSSCYSMYSASLALF